MPSLIHADSPNKFHHRGVRFTALAILIGVLLTLPLAACGSTATTPTSSGGQAATSTSTSVAATSTPVPATPTPRPQTTPTPTSTPVPSTTALNVYFMRTDKLGVGHRTVPKTQQIGTAAVKELLKGPNAQEKAAGLTTSIPSGTKFLGLNIANKIATVNLSSDYESGGGSLSMSARLAQVVFTLTQFPTIDQVDFQLDGRAVTVFGGEGLVLDHPVGRSNYESLTPAIFVETPAVGDTLTSPVRLTGTANTFEAAFTIDVVDASGKVLTEQHAQATSGSGTRGTFDVSVPFKVDQKQQGKVVVFEISAKDGSRTNQVEIPVTLSP